MSLLLDVLRRAEAVGPAPANPAEPLQLEFEPLEVEPPAPAWAPPPPSPPAPPPAYTPTPQPVPSVERPVAAPPTRTGTSHWRYVGASSCASALATACWLWLAPAPAAFAPANAAPPPTATPGEPPAASAIALQPLEAPPATPLPTPAARAPRAEAPRRNKAPPEPEIRFSRSPAGASPLAALLGSAHAAYGAGDLGGARARYLEALASDPDNPDALDGLGAILLQEGRHDLARQLFRRALLVHPLDTAALAGLARAERPDPIQAESRLRDSLAGQPEAIGTQLALGDTLAAQQRWAEAQQAYFQAHGLAPRNPDIAYNLAVALDHLGQRRPAASFYRQALQLAEQQPARFPRHLCETRLHTLQAQDASP